MNTDNRTNFLIAAAYDDADPGCFDAHQTDNTSPDELMKIIRMVVADIDALTTQADNLRDSVRDLVLMTASALANRGELGPAEFNPIWKNGDKLTEEGVKEFDRLIAAGATASEIMYHLRISRSAVTYQMIKRQSA